jgi:hypothetical protein
MARGAAVSVAVLLLALPGVQLSRADEGGVVQALDALRGVQPVHGEEQLTRLNARLDAAWRVLESERGVSLPIVARELRAELAREQPDQFFVLDAAYFVLSGADPESEWPGATELALASLAAIDRAAPIIEMNGVGLLRLAHATARVAGPRAWPQLDRLFLDRDLSVEFFQAPHYVRLQPHGVRVLLYGATGPEVEDRLARLLAAGKHEELEPTLVAMLVELGSESSVEAVRALIQRRGDWRAFGMAVTMLMEVGGPAGRAAVLGARVEHLDSESRQYLESLRAAVQAVDYARLEKSVMAMDRESPLFDDEELVRRLQAYAQTGVDREISPGNLLKSRLPKDTLIVLLKQIRSRALWKLNQHALDEVWTANQIMNALQYREP